MVSPDVTNVPRSFAVSDGISVSGMAFAPACDIGHSENGLASRVRRPVCFDLVWDVAFDDVENAYGVERADCFDPAWDVASDDVDSHLGSEVVLASGLAQRRPSL